MLSIILAAGMGRRLNAGVPKCLIEIAGTSILKRQIAAMRAVGVTRFVIVVGYQHEQVRAHLADDPGQFTFVLNDRFAETNTIYSLYLAREHFGAGFLYANGDVLFDHRLPHTLLVRESLPAPGVSLVRESLPAPLPCEDAHETATSCSSGATGSLSASAASAAATVLAIKPGRCGQEEVKVIVYDGRITRIGKQLDPARSLGEFVGVARFGSDIIPAFASMLVRCVEIEGIVGDHFEQAVDRLCIAGEPVLPIEVGHLPCGEIDFPEDLRHAVANIAPRLL